MFKDSMEHINWKYMGDAVPAFLCLSLMPLTYNIAYGLLAGILSYIFINGVIYLVERIIGRKVIDQSLRQVSETSAREMLPPWLHKALPGSSLG